MIDSHAHLTSDGVYENIEEILQRAKNAGVKKLVNICTDPKTLERGLLLAKEHDYVYNVGSTTPHDVEKEGGLAFPFFEKAARDGSLIAIGETGLDYYYEHSDKKLQQKYLKKYISLAKELTLPLVFHCRDAFSDLFALTDNHPSILHCFTGNLEEAKECVARGWLISISGIATFKRSDELREIIKQIPLKNLIIETDTPYLAPQSKRGKQNEPSFILETAECIAYQKEIDVEDVIIATTQNVESFFSIS